MVSSTKGTTTLSLIYLAPIRHPIYTIHIYTIDSCAWLTFFMLLCGRVDIQEDLQREGEEDGDKAQDMEMKMEKFAC